VLVCCFERIGCTGAEPVLDGFYAENDFFVPPYDTMPCFAKLACYVGFRAGRGTVQTMLV
jgi:hypothetical protein